MVERGGGAAPGTRGSRRFVVGTLVGACKNEYIVRLEQDDPLDTVGWDKKGMVGRWSKSAVKALEESHE